MTTFRTIITALVVTGSVLFGSFVARATSTETVKYDPRNGNGPTIIIRGAFATAEDMTTLRLVEYDPENDRVVYRVVTP